MFIYFRMDRPLGVLMPHVSFHGKLMSERSNAEIVWVFLIVPPVLATVILAVVIGMAIRTGTEALRENLFGLVWCAIVLPAIAIGLPGVGWRELQKRKRLREQTESRPNPSEK